MFNLGFRSRFLRAAADRPRVKRVFDFYVRRHRDDLLGLGYHQFMRSGRGILILSCRYRDLFFGRGLNPDCQYMTIIQLKNSGLLSKSGKIPVYDPETELLVCLNVHNTDIRFYTKLSKRGLALSVLHRQYLNQLLNYATAPHVVPS